MTGFRAALGVIALLVAGLWFFRIPFAENVLRVRLSEIGVPVANLEIASLDPWRIEIRNLRLAAGPRLQQGEAKIEWSTPISPRFVRIRLTGLELELDASAAGLAWRGLGPAPQGNAANERDPVVENLSRLPEIQLLDATARLVAPDGSIAAELTVPSFSFVPTRGYSSGGIEGDAPWAAELKAELLLSNLRARNWALTDGSFEAAGRIEQRDGQLYYYSQGCEQVILTDLKRENVSVSGTLAVCLKGGGRSPAVVIGRDGRVALDLVAEPETAQIGLGIGALPLIPLELEGGYFSLQLSRKTKEPLVGRMTLRELNLRLPAAATAIDGLELAAMTGSADLAPHGWSFTMGARELRHVAEFQALRPVALEGKGNWTPKVLVVDTTLRQASPGLNASFHLRRDTETGEGEFSFDISPLEFREGGMHIADVSPMIARHVTRVSGKAEASGRILFNDAWATPLQITGTGENLVVGMEPSVSPMGDGNVTVDFGRSRFDISIPPLSPERGWATLDVIDGGLRHGDVDLKGSTGPINFVSLWPLTCNGGDGSRTETMDREDRVAATIVACFRDAIALNK